jgi:hypothetical protein
VKKVYPDWDHLNNDLAIINRINKKYIINYMEVSIIKTVYKKFNYINSELIQNILNHLNFNNYSGKGILTRKTYPIHLLQQIGGTKREIKLKDGYNYEYHIDEIIPMDDKNNRICFFNIEESHDNCKRIFSYYRNRIIRCFN